MTRDLSSPVRLGGGRGAARGGRFLGLRSKILIRREVWRIVLDTRSV